LNSKVIKYLHSHSGVQCIFLCVSEDTSCRSINFRKTSNCDKNCELLKDVASERPELLLKNEQFDHYILLNPKRVSMNHFTLKKFICVQWNVYHCCILVKAISDTVEHLVPRPLPARPRNSIWRQAKEWSFNGVYILYFLLLFLTFFFFLVGRTYILKCQVSYSLSEKRFYDRIFLKHS
jgi:hypothetical protein